MEKFASRELPLPHKRTVFETKPTWLLRGRNVGSWAWDTPNASETDAFVILSRSSNGHTHWLPPRVHSAHPTDTKPTARGLWHTRAVMNPSVSPPAPKHPPKARGRCRPLPAPPHTQTSTCHPQGMPWWQGKSIWFVVGEFFVYLFVCFLTLSLLLLR